MYPRPLLEYCYRLFTHSPRVGKFYLISLLYSSGLFLLFYYLNTWNIRFKRILFKHSNFFLSHSPNLLHFCLSLHPVSYHSKYYTYTFKILQTIVRKILVTACHIAYCIYTCFTLQVFHYTFPREIDNIVIT